MMEALEFFEMLFVAFTSALITFFLEFCFRPGNVFGKWIPFVEKHFRDNLKNPFHFMANPLGLCAYCQNIWITSGVFLIYYFEIGISGWWYVPTTMFSHFALNVLDKSFWRE